MSDARAALLHGTAMLVAGQTPLPEGLERLARDEPAFARWVQRLAPALRAGRPLPQALRQARVIGRRQLATLTVAVDSAALADALRRIADMGDAVTPGYGFVRWYPVWLAAALLLPGTLLSALLDVTTGGTLRAAYSELGIILPALARVTAQPPLIAVAIAAAMVVSVAGAQLLIERLRPVRHVLHLSCPEVHRLATACRLLRSARIGDDAPRRLGRARLWWYRSGLGVTRPNRPPWDADWRTWMILSRFRLSSTQRRLLRELPDLGPRVGAIGLGNAESAADWQSDEAELRRRLAEVIQRARWLLVGVLIAAAVVGWMFGQMMPVLAIIREVGGMT